MNIFSQRSERGTFRPKRSTPGPRGARLKSHIDATLGSGNLRDAVMLPPGEELNEWLAANTVDFYNAVNVLYGALAEYCTADTCPKMTAGNKYEYRWADGVRVKRPIECSAPDYVSYLMDWIERQLDDEKIFPQEHGNGFPSNFHRIVSTIFKRMFRVYAHMYHSHAQQLRELGAEAHLNTCFKHFIFFTQAFGLVDRRELAPLQELIDSLQDLPQPQVGLHQAQSQQQQQHRSEQSSDSSVQPSSESSRLGSDYAAPVSGR